MSSKAVVGLKLLLAVGLATAISAPLAASAASITNSFLTSSTGSPHLAVSDTIQFEVTITTDVGVNYNTIFWSLTGDATRAVGSTAGSGWAGVHNEVINWEWHYTRPGYGNVKMGTNGRIATTAPPIPTPDRVSGVYGFFGTNKTGDGIPALVGTVTLHITSEGTFQGGAFQFPGVDGFFGSAGGGPATVTGGSFSILGVPEPSTALLVFLGLGGMGFVGRQNRKPRPRTH